MFGSRHDRTSLICDIGSATVSASLVRFSPKAKPTILASLTLPLSISEISSSDLEIKVLGFLEQALTLLVTQEIPKVGSAVIKKKNVDSAYVVLSSPWYVSKATRVTVTKDKIFEIDEEFLQSTLDEQEKIFEREVLSGSHQTLSGEDIHMIEREILSVSLNGYETPNPYEKRARYALLSLYMSVVPQDFLTKVDGVLKKHFHIRQVQFHTFPLVFFRTIPTLFPHESDALFLNISGESTDVSFVSKNSIVNSTSFTQGRNTALREMMNELRINQEIALSLLRLGEAGTLDSKAELGLQNALSKDGVRWIKKCGDILSAEQNHTPIPSVCFLVCDDDVSALFLDRLKVVGASYGIPHIIPVTASVLNTHVTLGKYTTAGDRTLLLALFFTK